MTKPAPLQFPIFVPANRPERFAKAAASGTDSIILDLEDAVAADCKTAARAAANVSFTDLPVVLRINASDTEFHDDDLRLAASLPFAAVMLPKSEKADDISRVADMTGHPVIALVESAKGIAAARDLARSDAVMQLAFGSIDFCADLGCEHEREILLPIRQELVIASRLAQIAAPLDGVTADVKSPEITRADARHARALGMGGKLLIHPAQVAPVHEAWRPTAAETEWATKVLASGDGAVKVDGAMVDEPVRIRARAILAHNICL
ncbi:HpcH/HpaI aldolase/citrate lyase family protein [Brucella haematophila]|uniref:HpcH/HpaI aldolase/citrate lyase family protein n=1 Tax=Brucella haematophila TaxID=419474 RepID=UPI00110E1951|nr:CoA ester lyase [Brucella haematophila]TMV04532.1 CoA ester lyase [Brucella haematophila]